MKRSGRLKRALWVVSGAVVVTLVLLLAVAAYVGPRVSFKRHAPRSYAMPALLPDCAYPIAQHEPHTCGFLTLSAAYTAHGLSPEAKNLRVRLGVDTVAHPFDEQSTGTLHPDLLRVLAQDGFAYSFVDPSSPESANRITEHLAAGKFCVLLIRRRETGGLHWVLADSCAADAVRIVDSLADEPYDEAIDAFLRECVLSIITIEARLDGEPPDINGAHVDGLAELARVRESLAALDDPVG